MRTKEEIEAEIKRIQQWPYSVKVERNADLVIAALKWVLNS